MAIVQTIDNVYQFRAAFEAAGRKDQFSLEALEAMYNYLEDYSQDSGEDVALDVIALCCDWSEMSWRDIVDSYSVHLSDADDESLSVDEVEEFLAENTQYAKLSCGMFLFVNF